MNDARIFSVEDIKKFLQGSEKLTFRITAQKEKYIWIAGILLRFKYRRLKKKEKGIIKKYIARCAGYSPIQVKRLIKKFYEGKLQYALITRKRNKFRKLFFPKDIALLIKTDTAHDCLSGPATKRILKRECEVFRKNEYKIISEISISHLYNIRNYNRQYNSSEARFFKRTQATQINIGARRKPEPNGKPGYLRVDTIHQGDFNGQKSLYHNNIVDEATQYEMIGTVEKISEHYLKPVIKELLSLFPFRIYEFHSDNGSEFINHVVAELLNKLHIELTKSRSRYSNDNALVESKNGSVVRKLYGRNFIHKKYAKLINKFNKKYVNVYLNYHRPSGFAEIKIDKRGKEKKKYAYWMTPYEKLKSLDNAKQYLKKGISFEKLDKIAYAESDNEFAEKMRKEKYQVFKIIKS